MSLHNVRSSSASSPAGAPSGSAVSVQGFGYTGTSTLTRAANQTPYTANDVVGGALTIATAGPAGGGGVYITDIRWTLNITALPAAMTTFGMYFYNVTPPSAIADNSPFTFGSGDRASYLGKVLGLPAVLNGTGTASVTVEMNSVNKKIKVAGSNLFAYLVTDGAFTPAANSETYTLALELVGV